MVTLEQVLQNRSFHYTGKHECSKIVGPRGGVSEVCTRVRASGQVKTWKTRPGHFSLPVMYGLYEHSYITHDDASNWHVASECPAGCY